MDTAGLAAAVLVGSSSSGYVAQQVALDAPSRVSGLVLVGSPRSLHARPPIADEVERLSDPVDPAWVRESLTWFPPLPRRAGLVHRGPSPEDLVQLGTLTGQAATVRRGRRDQRPQHPRCRGDSSRQARISLVHPGGRHADRAISGTTLRRWLPPAPCAAELSKITTDTSASASPTLCSLCHYGSQHPARG